MLVCVGLQWGVFLVASRGRLSMRSGRLRPCTPRSHRIPHVRPSFDGTPGVTLTALPRPGDIKMLGMGSTARCCSAPRVKGCQQGSRGRAHTGRRAGAALSAAAAGGTAEPLLNARRCT